MLFSLINLFDSFDFNIIIFDDLSVAELHGAGVIYWLLFRLHYLFIISPLCEDVHPNLCSAFPLCAPPDITARGVMDSLLLYPPT